MSEGWVAGFVVVAVAVAVCGLFISAAQMKACGDAGGQPVWEYKNFPSCWSPDGRRMFP